MQTHDPLYRIVVSLRSYAYTKCIPIELSSPWLTAIAHCGTVFHIVKPTNRIQANYGSSSMGPKALVMDPMSFYKAWTYPHVGQATS